MTRKLVQTVITLREVPTEDMCRGASEIEVKDESEMAELLSSGAKTRATGSANMNKASSEVTQFSQSISNEGAHHRSRRAKSRWQSCTWSILLGLKGKSERKQKERGYKKRVSILIKDYWRSESDDFGFGR